MYTSYYNPPYDSPIEDIFAWTILKHLHDESVLAPQVEVDTPQGMFRLDFTLSRGNRSIGVECDGKEFHDYSRDMFRDSIILGCSDLGAVYRFRGGDIVYRIDSALFTLSTVEPHFFSDRGLTNLKQLAPRTARIYDGTEFLINGFTPEDSSIWIRALRRDYENPVWARLWAFAAERPNLGLDEIVAESDKAGLKWFRD